MSEPRFDLTIRCVASKIGLLMQVLAKEDGISITGDIRAVEEKTARRGHTRKNKTPRKRVNGAQTSVDVINALIQKKGVGKTFMLEEAGIACKNNGLSPQSASPRLSYFTRIGVTKLVKSGVYSVEKVLDTDMVKTLLRAEEARVRGART